MSLSSLQLESLCKALRSAFPTLSVLEQMVRFRLDKKLNEIITAGNLQDSVFALIQWAEAHGRLQDLIAGARESNPDNESLREWIEAYESSSPSERPPTEEEGSDVSKQYPSQEKEIPNVSEISLFQIILKWLGELRNKNKYRIMAPTISILALIILYFTILYFKMPLSHLVYEPTPTQAVISTPTPTIIFTPTLATISDMVFVYRARSAFLVDAHKVTYADYQDCIRNSSCSEFNNMGRGFAAPIVGISAENAKNYCRFRGKRLLKVDERDGLIEQPSERINTDLDALTVPKHDDFSELGIEIGGIKNLDQELVEDDPREVVNTGFRCAMDADMIQKNDNSESRRPIDNILVAVKGTIHDQ